MQSIFILKGNQRGMTLIELSVVLVIIGVLLGSGMSLLENVSSSVKREQTHKNLILIQQLLISMLADKSTLPCPDLKGDGSESISNHTTVAPKINVRNNIDVIFQTDGGVNGQRVQVVKSSEQSQDAIQGTKYCTLLSGNGSEKFISKIPWKSISLNNDHKFSAAFTREKTAQLTYVLQPQLIYNLRVDSPNNAILVNNANGIFTSHKQWLCSVLKKTIVDIETDNIGNLPILKYAQTGKKGIDQNQYAIPAFVLIDAMDDYNQDGDPLDGINVNVNDTSIEIESPLKMPSEEYDDVVVSSSIAEIIAKVCIA
jgi:prepilin-type N-terminal cleavage/methylation domain-containing protein